MTPCDSERGLAPNGQMSFTVVLETVNQSRMARTSPSEQGADGFRPEARHVGNGLLGTAH